MHTLLDIIKLAVARGARPISVTLETVPSNIRKACPSEFRPVRKVQRLSCMLNFRYEQSVNRQRTREGSEPSFKVQPTWFTHSDTPAVVVGNRSGKKHLQLKVERVLSCEYFNASGQPINAHDLKPYQYAKSKAIGQGLTKNVLCIEPAFQSIKQLTLDGTTYDVTN